MSIMMYSHDFLLAADFMASLVRDPPGMGLKLKMMLPSCGSTLSALPAPKTVGATVVLTTPANSADLAAMNLASVGPTSLHEAQCTVF